jgi:hypothetical protein
MDIVVLGIDLGKNSCSLAGLDVSQAGLLCDVECGEVRWRASSTDLGAAS